MFSCTMYRYIQVSPLTIEALTRTHTICMTPCIHCRQTWDDSPTETGSCSYKQLPWWHEVGPYYMNLLWALSPGNPSALDQSDLCNKNMLSLYIYIQRKKEGGLLQNDRPQFLSKLFIEYKLHWPDHCWYYYIRKYFFVEHIPIIFSGVIGKLITVLTELNLLLYILEKWWHQFHRIASCEWSWPWPLSHRLIFLCAQSYLPCINPIHISFDLKMHVKAHVPGEACGMRVWYYSFEASASAVSIWYNIVSSIQPLMNSSFVNTPSLFTSIVSNIFSVRTVGESVTSSDRWLPSML